MAVAPQLQPQHENSAHPCTYIRTTYFDTPDFSYYRSGTHAAAQRLRVREYASAATLDEMPVLSDRCFLELKQSSGGLRHKRRLRIPAGDVTAHLARLHDGKLQPCVTSWYRRNALADAADRIRITLDQGIAFCEPVTLGITGGNPQPSRVFARGPAFVLEVKLWDQQPDWLTAALQGLYEARGFSKFIFGMRAARRWLTNCHRRTDDVALRLAGVMAG